MAAPRASIRSGQTGEAQQLQQFTEARLIIGSPILTFDERIRAALDSTATTLREHLERELRTFSQEAARLAGEDRQQALTDGEAAAAEVRAHADAHVAQIRAAAQRHAEELKRAAETQIGELRKAVEEIRAQSQRQQAEAQQRLMQLQQQLDA